MDNLERQLNIKKAIVVGLVILIIIGIIILLSMYIAEEEFRNWIDINLLRKNKGLKSICLKAERSNHSVQHTLSLRNGYTVIGDEG